MLRRGRLVALGINALALHQCLRPAFPPRRQRGSFLLQIETADEYRPSGYTAGDSKGSYRHFLYLVNGRSVCRNILWIAFAAVRFPCAVRTAPARSDRVELLAAVLTFHAEPSPNIP